MRVVCAKFNFTFTFSPRCMTCVILSMCVCVFIVFVQNFIKIIKLQIKMISLLHSLYNIIVKSAYKSLSVCPLASLRLRIPGKNSELDVIHVPID